MDFASVVEQAHREAGHVNIEVQQCEYTTTMSMSEYPSGRETSLQAGFTRQRLNQAMWEHFREWLAQMFRSQFPDSTEDIKTAQSPLG